MSIIPDDLGIAGADLHESHGGRQTLVEVLRALEAKIDGANQPQSLSGSFVYDDTPIDIAATTATVPLGGALPEGAVVVALKGTLGTAFTDGSTGTFAANVGITGQTSKFSPAPIDIDGTLGAFQQQMYVAAGGDIPIVTFTGSVNLGTATAGVVDIELVYIAP